MKIQISKSDDCLEFKVEGKLDSVTSLEFGAVTESRIRENPVNVIFDLSELTYISSSGLRVFLQLAKTTKQNGTGLFIASIQDQVKEIFDLAGFMPYFNFTDSVDKARAAVKEKSE